MKRANLDANFNHLFISAYYLAANRVIRICTANMNFTVYVVFSSITRTIRQR